MTKAQDMPLASDSFTTSEDMYPRPGDLRFVFSLRSSFQGEQRWRWAIVSTARMDPRFFGEAADPELLKTRLRKILTKNVGMMYYQLPESRNPGSVLYSGIGSLAALDCVGEDF